MQGNTLASCNPNSKSKSNNKKISRNVSLNEMRVIQNRSKDKQYIEFDYINSSKVLDTKETDGVIQMLLRDIFAKI